MFVISFDMVISDLKKYYGEPHKFANSVRDIRAFRIEDWSNFTSRVKRKAINV